MKYIIPCLFIAACGQSNNELMIKLLNEKKVAEDSISYYGNSERYYKQQARQSYNIDTNKIKPYIDSSTAAWANARNCEIRLKEINFSIDSLTKMK